MLKNYLVTGMPASIATAAPPPTMTSQTRHGFLWRCIEAALRLARREEWNKMTRLSLLELQFGFTLLWVWSPGLPLRSTTVLVTLNVNNGWTHMKNCARNGAASLRSWRKVVLVVTLSVLCVLITQMNLKRLISWHKRKWEKLIDLLSFHSQ